MQGTFDHWDSNEFPTSIPDFYLVIRVRLSEQQPVKKLQLVFLDPEGTLAFSPADIEVQGPVTNTILRNKNVKVGSLGIYHAALLHGDKVIASLPLFVAKSTNRSVVPAAGLN